VGVKKRNMGCDYTRKYKVREERSKERGGREKLEKGGASTGVRRGRRV